MEGGRSFGAALSEVPGANTLTSSTGYAVSCRPVGGSPTPHPSASA